MEEKFIKYTPFVLCLGFLGKFLFVSPNILDLGLFSVGCMFSLAILLEYRKKDKKAIEERFQALEKRLKEMDDATKDTLNHVKNLKSVQAMSAINGVRF